MTTPPPQKTPAPQGWHSADVVAAIWKRGSSIIKLSRQHGLSKGALSNALRTSWPRAEKIIADFIGVTPQEIWPSRYHDDGTPKRGAHTRFLWRKASRPASNHSTAGRPRNVKEKRTA